MSGLTISVDLHPPCATCLHEPICVIRRAVEGMPPIEVPIPDTVFALGIVATVTCEHYLPERPPRRAYKKRAPAA